MANLRSVLLAVTFLTAAACTSKPVLDFHDVPLPERATSEDVRAAILAVGPKRGWVMEETAPGVIRATLPVRTHVAVVDIQYSSSNFGMTYVDSTNLDYKDGKIHRNYNRWVNNLRADIIADVQTRVID